MTDISPEFDARSDAHDPDVKALSDALSSGEPVIPREVVERGLIALAEAIGRTVIVSLMDGLPEAVRASLAQVADDLMKD